MVYRSMTLNTRSALGQLSDLSDQDLLAHIHLAAQAERRATAHLVALLIELDRRRLYLGEGFPSLFAYCTDALHLSEPAAYFGPLQVPLVREEREAYGVIGNSFQERVRCIGTGG